MTVVTKTQRRLKRRRRVRAKVVGTAERPRISVFRSNRGIQAQLVDDLAGRTLAAVSWTEPDLRIAQADGAGREGGRGCSPSARRRPGSTRRSSTVAATGTTDGSRRSPRACAKED